jgi:hypothetical protein
MPGSLEFHRAAARICPIEGDRQIPVIGPIQELCSFVVVEHAESYKLIGVYLADIKGKPLREEILAPVENVHGDRLLRTAALQAVQIEA